MASTEYSVRFRGHLRARVTKLHDKIRDSLSSFSSSEKQTHLTTLENLKKDIKILDDAICASLWDTNKDETLLCAEWDSCDSYEEKL
jgi:hypothetical protein